MVNRLNADGVALWYLFRSFLQLVDTRPLGEGSSVDDGLLDNPTAATANHEVVDSPTRGVQSPARLNLIAPSGAPHGASAPPCYALPISVCRLPVLVRPLGSAHAHHG